MSDSDNIENTQNDITANPFPDMDQMDSADEIVLGNEFDETASVIIPRSTNHTYMQVNKFRGVKLFFKIYNDIYLHKSVESFRDKNLNLPDLT